MADEREPPADTSWVEMESVGTSPWTVLAFTLAVLALVAAIVAVAVVAVLMAS